MSAPEALIEGQGVLSKAPATENLFRPLHRLIYFRPWAPLYVCDIWALCHPHVVHSMYCQDIGSEPATGVAIDLPAPVSKNLATRLAVGRGGGHRRVPARTRTFLRRGGKKRRNEKRKETCSSLQGCRGNKSDLQGLLSPFATTSSRLPTTDFRGVAQGGTRRGCPAGGCP